MTDVLRIRGFALAVALAAGCGRDRAAVRVDDSAWKDLGPRSEIWPRTRYDVVADGRRSEVFRTGVAILRVPVGVDPEEHAQKVGLVPLARLSAIPEPRIVSRDKAVHGALERRRRRLPTELISRVLLVRLAQDVGDDAALSQYLARKRWDGTTLRVTSQRGHRTLAAIAAHQLRWEAHGYSLTLDVGRAPFDLVQATDEGSGGDALADDYAAITNLRRAWMLAQIAETPFAAPTQGFSDGRTVTGPAILGIVDDGFATTTVDFAPDILFPPDAPIGGAGMQDFHGTKATSMAMSPISNDIPGAGSCPYSAGSALPAFSPTARVALLWSDAPEPDNWSGALGIGGAIAGGADVVNMSWGTDCDWWCRNFGSVSGWNVLSDALVLAKDIGVALVAAAGNAGVDLNDKYIIPCEMDDGRPVCVGGIDRNEDNQFNFGSTVHVWAPGQSIEASPTPNHPAGTTFSGTSAAAPFVSGLSAAATAMRGSTFSTSALRNALTETSRASINDSHAPRVVDAYRFFRRYARVRADAREPNDLGNIEWSTAPTPAHENLTISEPLWYAPDEDYLVIEGVPKCSSVVISLRYLDDPVLGELDVHYLYGAAHRVLTRPTPDRLVVAGERIRSLWHASGGKTYLGVRTTGGFTTGYWIEGVTVTAPAFSSEGPSISATCNGVDDDCDGVVDEGFADNDHDDTADCVDPDDDYDCIADADDNCPLVRNADPYCSALGPFVSDCGSSCPYLRRTRPTAALETLVLCVGQSGFPPGCWNDGCPYPELLNDPLLLAAMRDVQRDPIGVSPRIRDAVRAFDFSTPGRVRIGPGVPQRPPGAEMPPVLCKRVAPMLAKHFEDVQAECAEWAAEQDCQNDSDGDGIGDACETPP